MRAHLTALAVGLITATGIDAAAQESKSVAAAATLVELMKTKSLEQFAVKVSGEADMYVSVMHIPNAQLLVVSGRHPVPSAIDARIAARDFAGAYADHNGSTLREGKLFVMDIGANGLVVTPGRNNPFDVTYENGERSTMFDGDWRGQKLSERDYRARFADIDGRYAKMLDTLSEALRQLSPADSE
jgi:hypothetical protein